MNGIGIGIGRKRKNWTKYWATQSEVLFFGEISKIRDGKLYNQKSGATDYLTVGGTAGSYTFQCPNTTPYIAADTDGVWFNSDETPRTATEAELIGYDLQRTPVKYLDDVPNSIKAIMILRSAVTGSKRDRMFRDFHLPIMWDNSWNDYGHEKYNRPDTEQILYLATPFNIVLTLITGGVQVDWISDYSIEIWGQSDGTNYALINTINAGTITFDDITTPVDLRYYKLRAKDGDRYSIFTTPISIAMLGAELVNQILWRAVGLTWWNSRVDSDFAGNGSVLTVSTGSAQLIKTFYLIVGKSYKVTVTASLAATAYLDSGTGLLTMTSGTGTRTAIIISSATQLRLRTSSTVGLRTFTYLSVKEVLV